jgi:hypothetical protein
MVNVRHGVYTFIAMSAILTGGVTVFGEQEEEGENQGIVPASVYSPSTAADQAYEMRALSVKASGSFGKQVAITAQPPVGSAQPQWINVGPTGYGRVWDIEVDPTSDQIVYMAGSSGGGVWKSIDGGTSWKFISNHFKSQSIGDIAIDPSNHNTIWVGTGEELPGGGSISYPGCGVYKSTDAGVTWQFMGLGGDSSLQITRVTIHPTNPNIVLVGAMGGLFYNTHNRGVYRTADGGTTWTLVHYDNDSTGCADVQFNPGNPARVVACMWTAMRYPFARTWVSPASRVWISNDTGKTWTVVSSGLPTTDLGRSSLAWSKSNTQAVYLIYFGSTTIKGTYKSTDGGTTWAQTAGTPSSGLFSYYGYTFCQIRCNPTNEADVIALGMTCERTQNSGGSWAACFPTSLHLDFHAVAWSTQTSNTMFVGDDGGITKGTAGPGGSFTYLGRGAMAGNGYSPGGLLISQVYAVDVARDNSSYRYAGFQDEGTNSCTNGGTTYADWVQRISGDGFTVRVDPGNCVYAIGCLQYGAYYLATNRTTFNAFSIGGTRKQWKSPVAFDSISGRAYTGSELVCMATRGSSAFSQISTDLTNGDHSAEGHYPYGTISALGAHNGACYAGTDDGNVWVSKNATSASATWTKIRNGLSHSGDAIPWKGPQERTDADGWITDIWVDRSEATGATAYLAVWYFRWGRSAYKPSIYKLTNYGTGGVGSADWTDIHGDLPPSITTTAVRKDNNPNRSGWLYCSTDYGTYYSTNSGTNWIWMGDTSLPIVNCTDMCLHGDTLYVGTYGHGINIINLALLPPVPTVAVNRDYQVVSKGTQTLGNYPNPVVNRTTIKFSVKDPQLITVAVYDMSGREVYRLLDKKVEGNKLQTVTWNRTNNSGSRVAAGNYICRVLGEKVTLAKLIMVK